jgi:hypothetical protein
MLGLAEPQFGTCFKASQWEGSDCIRTVMHRCIESVRLYSHVHTIVMW